MTAQPCRRRLDRVQPLDALDDFVQIGARGTTLEGSLEQLPRSRHVAAGEQLLRLLHQRIGLALSFGLRTPRPFDVGTCPIVMPIEEQHASPEMDGVFVAMSEVLVESGEEQLLDARLAFSAAQRLGGTRVGAERIHEPTLIIKEKAGTLTRPGLTACSTAAATQAVAVSSLEPVAYQKRKINEKR